MELSDIKWTGEISIQQVLADIREHPENTFWLAWIRATGKDAGSLKIVSTAIYGATRKEFISKPWTETVIIATFLGATFGYEKDVDRNQPHHTDKGTLPMTDKTTGIYLTPLISHIIGYNLMKVKH